MDELDLFAEDVEAAEVASLTQRAIVDTQQNLGKMLDLMPIGLLIHTEQGIVFANRRHAASYRTGWPSSEGNTFTASFRASDTSFERMLKRADTALYVAKAEGRNRVCPSD